MLFSLYSALPLTKKVRYLVSSNNIYTTNANIIKANKIDPNPNVAIAKIMLKDYLERREAYDYDKLKKQFSFVKNTSTRLVFKKFYDFMDIDNSQSPVIRYQRYVRRDISVISVNYLSKGQADVVFESMARSGSGEVLENMLWKASVNFEMDEISYDIPPGSDFRFTVTDYSLALLKNKLDKVGDGI